MSDESKIYPAENLSFQGIVAILRNLEGRARNGPLRHQINLVRDFLGAVGYGLQIRKDTGRGEIFGFCSGGLAFTKKSVTQIQYVPEEFTFFRGQNFRVHHLSHEYQGPFGWVVITLPQGIYSTDYFRKHNLHVGRNALWHFPQIDLVEVQEELRQQEIQKLLANRDSGL